MSFDTEIKRMRAAADAFVRSNKPTVNLARLTESEVIRLEVLYNQRKLSPLTDSDAAEFERLELIAAGPLSTPARDVFVALGATSDRWPSLWAKHNGAASSPLESAYHELESAIDSGNAERITAAMACGVEILKGQQV